MNNRAATLVEIMVTLAIFSGFMTMATILFSSTFKYYRAEEGPARLKEQARVALYRVSKCLRNCDSIIEPSYVDLVADDHSYIVLRVPSNEGTRTVGYRRTLDEALEEITYANDYRPDKPETHHDISTRVVCRKVNKFSVGVEDPRKPSLFTLKLEVQVSKSPLNLQTRMNLRNPQ